MSVFGGAPSPGLAGGTGLVGGAGAAATGLSGGLPKCEKTTTAMATAPPPTSSSTRAATSATIHTLIPGRRERAVVARAGATPALAAAAGRDRGAGAGATAAAEPFAGGFPTRNTWEQAGQRTCLPRLSSGNL